jgi:pimeloyl-[acyl-carrier protein] methyl ester esterase
VLLAARYPGRIRAVVLVASFVRPPSRLARFLEPLLRILFFAGPPPSVALRLTLLGVDAAENDVMELRATLRSVSPAVLAARLHAIASVDASEAFAAGTAPLLYIAGARDRLVGKRSLEDMHRLRPDMETRTLDAPHLVLQRAPENAARIVSEFISRWIT